MTAEALPDGPDLQAMLQLLRDEFPDAVVATIDSAAFLSLDEKHWPNFATVVWTDEHDEGAPSNLARAQPDPRDRPHHAHAADQAGA